MKFPLSPAAGVLLFAAILPGSRQTAGAVSLSPPVVNAGQLIFTVDSMPDQLVTLQAAEAVPGVWADLSYHRGTGNPISFSNSLTGMERFFRVRVTTFQPLALSPKLPTLASLAVSLPDAEVGASYEATVSAALTGIPPYTLQVSGTPPDGLALTIVSNGTGGAVVRIGTNGAAMVAGQRRQFTVSATDSANATATSTYDMRVISPAPTILTGSIVLKAGQPANASLAATNGTAPLSWSILSGPTPSGVALSSAGVVSGTPDVADAEFMESGRFTNVVQVTDAHTDRVTGAAAPRVATRTVVQLVRLSWEGNIWNERPNGPSLSTICIFCHGAGFTPDLTPIATTIIGVPSQAADCPDRIYVRPGDPEGSLIYNKVRGPDCGDRMPLGGPYFEETALERVKRWIEELTPQDMD